MEISISHAKIVSAFCALFFISSHLTQAAAEDYLLEKIGFPKSSRHLVIFSHSEIGIAYLKISIPSKEIEKIFNSMSATPLYMYPKGPENVFSKTSYSCSDWHPQVKKVERSGIFNTPSGEYVQFMISQSSPENADLYLAIGGL